MQHFSYVFVVLVYKNTQDLQEFFEHFHLEDTKVIIVNSFYNKDTDITFREIAQKNDADYLSVPNKGYGAGNNAGIQYALQHYTFSHLVISNPDIIIENYVKAELLISDGIIAPMIKTLTGKNQNPYSIFCNILFDKFKLHAINSKKSYLKYLYYSIIKISREVFLLFTKFNNRKYYKIAIAHGSHIIIPYKILNQIHPIYNEDMFLFCEEEHLGKLVKTKNISTYYYPLIRVIHKEDGSVGMANLSTTKILNKSYNIYYDYWYHK